ncbi:NERD domain-containing protein [Oceanobacillus piezotolerans]|uniref:NERD domain-containing protein n=1 Tax=Oceanobacillus piezotolerans TaxID=2448030 RepID=A0A498DJW8_9BACI|nr:nuclease-related domain-containing protein [Oceanobacillus piezotolerans]RLL46772.1 NERD domain-containing protein [Oceanobacillus piezotolerans]
MYIPQRTKPLTLLCYEALFRMLKEKYRYNKILNQEYGHHLAGYLGERQIDYKLGAYPSKDLLYIQGLRLKNNNRFFQMDSVLLSTKFLLILEIKNWKGELTFNQETNNITQSYQNIEKSYQNPLLQVQTHEVQFIEWLQQATQLQSLPIESLAVISDSTTILKNPNNAPHLYNKLIYGDNIIPKIKELKDKYSRHVITKDNLKKLKQTLIQSDNPLHPDFIKQYRLSKDYFVNGIPCENCGHSPMHRYYKVWRCDHCDYRDQFAHVRKILDYFLLIQRTITNRECRKLLKIESPKTAYYILNSMNLKRTGRNSARKYHAPPPNQYPQDSSVPNKKKSIFSIT